MKPRTRLECDEKRRKLNVKRGQYMRHAKAGVDKLFNDVVQCLKEKREVKHEPVGESTTTDDRGT